MSELQAEMRETSVGKVGRAKGALFYTPEQHYHRYKSM